MGLARAEVEAIIITVKAVVGRSMRAVLYKAAEHARFELLEAAPLHDAGPEGRKAKPVIVAKVENKLKCIVGRVRSS